MGNVETIHKERNSRLPENQNEFIEEIVKKSGVDYNTILNGLFECLVISMEISEYLFITEVIFRQTPLNIVSMLFGMTLSQGEEFLQKCIDKLSCIMRKENEK